jgi:hypothetical protein
MDRSGVAEDAVVYQIYFDAHIHLNASCAPALKELAIICSKLLAQAAALAGDYLWHKESFNLRVYDSETQSDNLKEGQYASCPHLHGRVAVGDNIEDEWFVVWLLREISKTSPNATIRVFDSDGQFLLIEAADEIPNWLQPDNSDGRVFIRRGLVHVIPKPSSPAELADIPLNPSVAQGLLLVSAGRHATLPSKSIQGALTRRIADFPGAAMTSNNHCFNVIVPLHVAYVLDRCPDLIGKAVGALYLRDLIDQRSANKMARFIPDPAQVVFVSKRIRATRCMYAQLLNQQYAAPKPLRVMPELRMEHASKRRKAADLGVKVACGLEMYYQNEERRRRRERQTRERPWSSRPDAGAEVTPEQMYVVAVFIISVCNNKEKRLL